MAQTTRSLMIGLFFARLLVWVVPAASAEEVSNPILLEPMRYASVDGNITKFQTHHWMRDGFAGGVERFSLEQKREDDVVIALDGKAIVNEEYAVGVEIDKEEKWYVHADFNQWTRYYDVRGGSDAFRPLTSATGLNRELALDIGEFEVELGLFFETFPDIRLRYEHGYKEGTKSRLAWFTSTEPGSNRKIMPGYEEIDETEDSIELELTHNLLGFDVTATEYWEFVRDSSTLITTNSAVREIKEPDNASTNIFMSTFKAERWFSKDTTFIGASYRYTELDNSVLGELFEYNINTGAKLANTHGGPDNTAFNKYDSHVVLGNLLFRLFGWQDWTVITKAKAEWDRRHGTSVNNHDENVNGIIDYSYWRDDEDYIDALAQAVSLRYTGIDRVALYGELDFEQVDNFLDENAWGIDGAAAAGTGNTFTRKTATDINRNSYTAGIKASPRNDIDITSEYRYKTTDNDFNNFNLSHPGTNPESAYIDSLFLTTNEASAKVTYRPHRRIRPSARYKYQSIDYDTTARFEDKTQSTEDSQIIAADLYVQPLDNLSLTGTYQLQFQHIKTPAENSTRLMYPAADMDYRTWMVVADWVLNNALTATGSVMHTVADENFNDEQSAFLLMYGPEFDQLDVTVGLQWKIKEGVVFEPKYAFYHYNGDHLDAGGDYDAHVFWFKVSAAWG